MTALSLPNQSNMYASNAETDTCNSAADVKLVGVRVHVLVHVHFERMRKHMPQIPPLPCVKSQCGLISPQLGWRLSRLDERILEATIQEQGAIQLCPDHHGPLAPSGLPSADSAEVTASLRTAATALGGLYALGVSALGSQDCLRSPQPRLTCEGTKVHIE